MELKMLSDDGEVLRLRLAGRIVQGNLAPEHDPMGRLLDERGYARSVLLSLADTDYIDSSGLAMLLVWHKRFAQAGGKLVLHSIPVPVMETLRILRMELVLHLTKDESAALAVAQGDSP